MLKFLKQKLRISLGGIRRLTVAVCVISVALFVFSCNKGDERAVYGVKAPDFTLSDINGNKTSLSALRGKVVMVDFWATWCPPCRESVPDLKAIYEKYKDRGFVLLGISVDKGNGISAEVSSFVKEYSITYPVLIDDGRVNVLYGVASIPTSFIINRDGKIANKHIGFIPGSEDELSKEIEALL